MRNGPGRPLAPAARLLALALVLCALVPSPGGAQPIETGPGVRAAGLGGAFVGVADDASAVYWNPAGLATGALFSLAVEWQTGELLPDEPTAAASDHSAAFFGLSVPSLGLSSYRLRSSSVRALSIADPGPDREIEGSAPVRVGSIVTQNIGVTLVQSVAAGLAVGSTVRFVRGSVVLTDEVGDRDDLLDRVTDFVGRADNNFDLDLGAIWDLGRARIGLVARNLREPSFEAPSGETLELDRQVRVGAAFLAQDRLTVAVDLDVTTTPAGAGERRNLAVGAERWFGQRRVGVRGGLRGSVIDEARPSYSVGVSVAVRSAIYLDAQLTRGADDSDRGWGVAGRIGF